MRRRFDLLPMEPKANRWTDEHLCENSCKLDSFSDTGNFAKDIARLFAVVEVVTIAAFASSKIFTFVGDYARPLYSLKEIQVRDDHRHSPCTETD